MNIRPRSIPKFQGGNNIWYLGLIDYDPTKYLISYDTSRLINGDMSDTILSPWKSNISGYDVGRYLPTNHGAFGEGKEHYNYTLGVEGLDYYKKFGEDLLDSNGNFTPTGEAWAKAVDALLPNGSNASFYDPKTGQLRTSWTTQYRDAHGRPAQTFTNLKDYVNHVRNDLLLGARHNVFLNKGKRYFYIDNLGLKHWVDPSVIDKYNVSKDPSEQGWEGTTYWDDYELTGLKDPSKTPGTDSSKTGGGIPVGEKADPESFWSKLGAGLKNVAPDLLDALRLAGNMHNNDRVYNESMKAIIPNLLQSYTTHRLIVGDEATKLAYYRRAAQGQTKAGQPFTSDADRLVAYMNEAKRIGDELRAQGDLADNQEIRRTSDESNQHQWANILRNTEVANNNLTELIKAAAAKHQLTAQKYSADWTNIDLFLLGKLAKLELEKAKLKALLDLIDMLTMLDAIFDDPGYKNAYNNLLTVALKYTKEGITDWNNPEVMKASRALLKAKNQYLINYYRTKSAKSGTKLTYSDNTDKYLYRTSRDIVEHFRRMSKMTDDSRVRTLPKTAKLTSHPKKRKYLLGGVAPFTIYRPLGVGGESAISTQTSSSGSSKSEKDTASKDKLDMIKELFKSVQGLPIDASKVYSQISGLLSKYKAFGEEMSTDDIASMYLSAMNQINHLKYSQDAYNKAHAVAVANDSLDEIAVGVDGKMALLNAEGEVTLGTYAKWKESEGKLNPLTNGQLLTMRAHSPNLAFNDEVFDIVNNGIGLTKISSQIKSMAASLGSSTEKIEGITEVESKLVKAGLKILAGTDGTPDGHYLVTTNTKEQSQLVKAALNYIYTMLPKNYKTILALHSGSEENSKALILNFLVSLADSVIELTITPLTGKASNSENNGKGGNITPAIALSMGLGERETFVIADKTSDGLKVSAVNLPILDASHNPLAVATLQLVGNGDYAGQLQLNSATMGGVKISPEGINNILISEGRIHAAELPVDKQALLLGIIKPDLNFLKNIEAADLQIREAGITNRDNLTPELINIINNIYTKNGLPMIYSMGANGPVLTSEYRRFAMMKATAPQEAFEEDLTFNDGVVEASEEDRNRFESMMKLVSRNSKYSLDNGISVPFFGRLSGTDLYKGIVYIPMSESHISALASTGFSASPEKYNEIDALDLLALFIKSSGYKNPGSWTK